MSELPAGWEWTTIGEVGDVMLGRQRSPKWHHGSHMRPYLRVANVFEDRIDLSDVKEMDFPPDQYERYKLEPGDILLNEGQSPEWVGRPAMYRGELPGVCFTNSLIRFRPRTGVDGRYALHLFRHHLHSRRFMREARITTNIAHLSSKRFTTVEFPLPPLAEQERIVAAIEEHLSRVDGAEQTLGRIPVRFDRLTWAPVDELWARADIRRAALGEVGSIVTGATPKASSTGHWGEDCLFATPGDLIHGGQLTETDRRLSAKGFDAARSVPGESVLVTCIGATLGKAAVTSVPAAFNQQINGLTPNAEIATAGYLLAVLSCPKGQQELWGASSSTTLPILNKGRFSKLCVPLPPLQLQRDVEAQVSSTRGHVDALAVELHRAARQASTLRRSILAAAFSGHLVSQDPDDEPAAVLLERIRAERVAITPTKRTRKAKVS